MSRTYKDRPWRVKANDPKEDRVAYHDHRLFGKRVYVRNGWSVRPEKQLVEFGDHVWILRYTHETPGMTPEEYEIAERRWNYRWIDRILRADGRLRWYFERRTRYELVGGTEKQHETYYDHCTIDEPFDPRNPCSYDLDWHRQYGYRPSQKDKAAYYHGPTRRAEREAMLHMREEYNTFQDVDDSQWQNYSPRRAPFNGGWWD